MKELISIVVPVYNAESTLERCVSALRRQTYENIEIILVNDGSKDGSLALCLQFSEEDPRIRVIDKPNGGVSSARNAGIDGARGKFVMFCDSDDWTDPEWCAAMAEAYQPRQLAVCDFFWDEVPALTGSEQEQTVPKQQYLHRTKLMCSPINKLFEVEVLDSNRIRFSEELSLGEDFVFCLTYLCAIDGDVRYVYRQLYHYDTANEGSLSKKAPALEQCELFYRKVTEAMQILGALDETSTTNRNILVAPHFERYLKGAARDQSLSVWQKLAAAGRVSKAEGFRNTCAQGIRWGNPIYLWLMQHGCARMGMLYLLTVLFVKKRV